MEDNKKIEDQLLADMMLIDDEDQDEAQEEQREEVKILSLDEIQKIREQYQVSYPKLSQVKVAKVDVPEVKIEEEKKQENSDY